MKRQGFTTKESAKHQFGFQQQHSDTAFPQASADAYLQSIGAANMQIASAHYAQVQYSLVHAHITRARHWTRAGARIHLACTALDARWQARWSMILKQRHILDR